MNPNWLVDELEQDLHKGKRPIGKVIIILSAALLLSGGAFAIASHHDNGSNIPTSTASITASSDTPTPIPPPTTAPAKPLPPVATTVAIAPTTSHIPSMAEVKAKLCINVIASAKEQGKFYLSEFNGAWKSWNGDFAGRYDSPEANASKIEYKRIIHNLFDDLINTNDPTMRTACDSTDSLANIVLQPNYDAWQ